jgi:putative membrane protein
MRFPTTKQWQALFTATTFAAVLSAQDPKTGQSGQTADRATASNAATLPQEEQDFIRDVAASGHKEVELGKMAQKNASSKEVKSFGQKLVRDHTQANNKLQALARKKGVELPDYPAPGMSSSTQTGAADTPRATPDPQREAGRTPTTSPDPARTETAEQRKGTPPAGTPSANPHEGHADRSGHMHGSELSSLTGDAFDRRFLEMMVENHQKSVEKFESMQSKVSDSDLRKFISDTLPTLREHLQTAKSLQSKTSSSGTRSN